MADRTLMRTVLVFVVAACLALVPLNAVAQADDAAKDPDRPNREGFTFETSLGFGIQVISGGGASDTRYGISGLTLGLGGFLNPQVALLFRIMGTVGFDEPVPGVSVTTVSGTFGPAVQWWPMDMVRLEGGLGVGFAQAEASTNISGYNVSIADSEAGFGLMLGAAWAFWQNRKHSVSLGFDYAPVFLDGGTFHNMGIVFGYQLL